MDKQEDGPSPFEEAAMMALPSPPPQQPQPPGAVAAAAPSPTPHPAEQQRGTGGWSWCSCFCCKSAANGEQQQLPAGATGATPGTGPAQAGAPLRSGLFSRKLSAKLSSTRSGGSGGAGNRLAQQASRAYTDCDWHSALSHATPSMDLAQRLLDVEGSASLPASRSITPVQQQPPQQQLPGPWVPDPPLLFAEPGLQWVPLPAVTGFAGIWDIDEERTTPFPQPIDVMIGASFLVRKVHASIRFMQFGESATELTITTQPSWVPPRVPTVYCENYSKGGSLTSWTPRRDLQLGSCYGRIYLSSNGVLVLRCEARRPFSTKPVFITEDYCMLQDGGNVIVDRMCCRCLLTGRSATQYYVGRRRPGT